MRVALREWRNTDRTLIWGRIWFRFHWYEGLVNQVHVVPRYFGTIGDLNSLFHCNGDDPKTFNDAPIRCSFHPWIVYSSVRQNYTNCFAKWQDYENKLLELVGETISFSSCGLYGNTSQSIFTFILDLKLDGVCLDHWFRRHGYRCRHPLVPLCDLQFSPGCLHLLFVRIYWPSEGAVAREATQSFSQRVTLLHQIEPDALYWQSSKDHRYKDLETIMILWPKLRMEWRSGQNMYEEGDDKYLLNYEDTEILLFIPAYRPRVPYARVEAEGGERRDTWAGSLGAAPPRCKGFEGARLPPGTSIEGPLISN